MRQFALILISMSMVACGKGFKAQGAIEQKSQVGGANVPYVPAPTVPQNPTVGVNQVNGLSLDLVAALLKLFKSFGNINSIDVTRSSQTLTATETVTCPLGGTITATATGNLSLSVSISAAGGTVVNGSGSVAFNNCQVEGGFSINGTVNLAGVNANLVAALNLQDNNTYSVTAAHQIVGNVQLSAGTVQQTCTLALSNAVNVDGSFHIATRTANSTITARVTGSVCGLAVDKSLSQAF